MKNGGQVRNSAGFISSQFATISHDSDRGVRALPSSSAEKAISGQQMKQIEAIYG